MSTFPPLNPIKSALSLTLNAIKYSFFQIDRRSKSANKRGTAFLVQYNGTWANGKWEGAGVLIILKIITE